MTTRGDEGETSCVREESAREYVRARSKRIDCRGVRKKEENISTWNVNMSRVSNVFLSAKRLERAGRVCRDERNAIRKLLINKSSGERSRGRPRKRWRDRVNTIVRTVYGAANLESAVYRNESRVLNRSCEINDWERGKKQILYSVTDLRETTRICVFFFSIFI